MSVSLSREKTMGADLDATDRAGVAQLAMRARSMETTSNQASEDR
jgi:hypothetical protein